MKKLMIALMGAGVLFACKQEKSIEERFIYEDDKITDIETGDQYLLEESESEFVLVHDDGSKETIAIEEAPFFGTTLSEDYVSDWKRSIKEREEVLLQEKKEQLKKARKERYADLSDDELMKKFQKSHKENVDMAIQMDMVAELVDRNVVSDDDASDLLEIEPELVNLDIELESPEIQ
ncbi:hypothetical protein MM239_15735 [Belliella sp. DSM 111904]|uniref:Lipoprotein n=1 Tax=Belliella filtrata TaxID=2923435 RepID=A0ABS9V3R3_9BACT|nr:hypothetical protein [Belliella filtrata]MCH7410859.1 hypothetical protein [Belliella filtrata]